MNTFRSQWGPYSIEGACEEIRPLGGDTWSAKVVKVTRTDARPPEIIQNAPGFLHFGQTRRAAEEKAITAVQKWLDTISG